LAAAQPSPGPPAGGPPMGPKVADAKPGDVRLIVTGAFQALLMPLVPEAQKAVGSPLLVEYGPARGNLRKEILDGQDFEVAVLLPDVNQEIFADGKTMPGSYDVARQPLSARYP